MRGNVNLILPSMESISRISLNFLKVKQRVIVTSDLDMTKNDI